MRIRCSGGMRDEWMSYNKAIFGSYPKVIGCKFHRSLGRFQHQWWSQTTIQPTEPGIMSSVPHHRSQLRVRRHEDLSIPFGFDYFLIETDFIHVFEHDSFFPPVGFGKTKIMKTRTQLESNLPSQCNCPDQEQPLCLGVGSEF